MFPTWFFFQRQVWFWSHLESTWRIEKILKRDFEWSQFALIEPKWPFMLPISRFFVVWHKFSWGKPLPQIESTAGYMWERITLCIISNLSSTRKPFNTCLSGSPERVFSPFGLLYLGVFDGSVTHFLVCMGAAAIGFNNWI